MKSELEALGREARALLDPGPAGAPPTAFLDRADGTTRRRRVRVAAGALTLALALTVGLLSVRGAAPAARVLPDGTVLEAAPTAVVEVDDDGPAPVVRLSRGRVVVRTAGAAPTTLSLGRWVVHLTSSARFAADTSRGGGSLVVLEGSVEVRDGTVRRVVHAGEELELSAPPVVLAQPSASSPSAPPGSLTPPSAPSPTPAPAPPSLSSPRTSPRIAPAPTPRLEPAPVTSAPQRPAEARTPPAPEAPPSWSEWVAEGRSAAVLQAALPRLEQVLRSERAGALVALADASRFEQRFDVSERACEAVRARFPGTPEAAHARFMQGRLAERRGEVGAALSHYEAYVQEAPAGPLAPEAFARRVQLEADRGNVDRACSLAKEYLSRFPSGSLARQFRERCRLD